MSIDTTKIQNTSISDELKISEKASNDDEISEIKDSDIGCVGGQCKPNNYNAENACHEVSVNYPSALYLNDVSRFRHEKMLNNEDYFDSVSNNKQQCRKNNDVETEELVNEFISRKKNRKFTVFHSDSEDESIPTAICEGNSDDQNNDSEKVYRKKHKRIGVFNSDSEQESEDGPIQGYDINEKLEYKSVAHNDNGGRTEINRQHQDEIISTLCDPESSDENNEEDSEKGEENISDSELKALQCHEVISKSRKGLTEQKCDHKTEKMTAKKALEQRKEILAESQRRVRESRVSLPYHKPKTRTLKEFLQNRPKLAAPLSEVSQGASRSISIKMSIQQLEIVSQKMKEREKEVEEFYKSESESEHEDEISSTTNISISCEPTVEENQNDDSIMKELINEELPKEGPENEDGNEMTTEIVTNIKNIDSTEDKVNQSTDEISQPSETGYTRKIDEEMIQCEITEVKETGKHEILDTKEYSESDQKTLIDVLNTDNPESCRSEESEVTESFQTEPIVLNESKERDTTKKSEKIILLSDVLVVPIKSNESNIKKYNLDAELLELASEAEKEVKDLNEDYEFNLDGIEDEMVENEGIIGRIDRFKAISKRRSAILEKLGELKPRLSVGPNEVIDLENGIAMPDEISRLRERFMKHNLKLEKNSNKKKEISITSVADGQIHRETLSLKMEENEDADMKPLEKPGVRMQKLREELQYQMAKRRSDLWREKLIKKNDCEKLDGDTDNDEKFDTKDILDDEDEEDFTDPEEELEENDCDMSENIRRKSDFVNEEAEESELEGNDDEEGLPEENEEEEEEYETQEEDEKVEEEEEMETVDHEETAQKKKVLKRIIRPLDDDSDDDNAPNKISDVVIKNNYSENFLTSVQPTNYKTTELVLSPHKSENHFATPVTYMTGLRNLNTSGLKFVDPEIEEGDKSLDKSEIHAKRAEKFEDSSVSAENSVNSNFLSTQDVLDICSGEFQNSLKCVSSPEISTQQLREVFTGSMKSSCDFNTQDMNDICSGGFTGISQTSQVKEKEMVLDDNDEHLISQLIDEDELENFKKKFESPGVANNSSTTKKLTLETLNEVSGTGGVIDSDDEEGGLKLKNKKRKRLAFSDDEESSMSDTPQEETIDLQDDEGLANVDYDSEENEVEAVDDQESSEGQKKEKIKASDFFEEEAELSESEWGSEDEDERNLDDLEFEKGDEENFDEDKLRTDIEKLQMRQMLDEDNREVKMLQELLLEDGELHGSGRQRQFRWKNIDTATNDAEVKKDDEDDDIYLEEDETEEQWRKERHQREMLKLKQQSQQEEDSLIIDSQSLSFAHKSLKIKSQTSLNSQTVCSELDSSPKVKQQFALLSKRGSFLSRGDKILQKIAETSKVTFASKNTNRIVFQTIDEDTKKRKASSTNIGDSTPVALKKLRLSGLSPGLNKDRPKLAKSIFEKILQD
ncbi:claspin-like [Coccinella septempunctata]|uniref:claspin-like n=1 Tax=Coccinella septempunctata TaxID=41139 RepID=UPI001D092B1C|nr:claspin-like [Coccinella septempunctata]